MTPGPQERAPDRGFRHAPPSARLVQMRAALDAVSGAGRAVSPWIDAAVRLWLAEGFLQGAAMTAVMHHAPAMASTGQLAQGFNDLVASPLGFAVQTLCPLLLLAGLLTRLAAVPLLIQLLLLHGLAWPADLQALGAVLLGWIAACGPGALSLDALLGQGGRSIALPGAARFAAGLLAVTGVSRPWAMLALRAWIVAALVAGLPLRGFAAGALPMAPGWLVSWPAGMDPRVAALAAVAGLLLAVGLATRAVALVLLLIVQGLATGMMFDHHAAWLLLLGLLAAHGPGPFSVDAWVRRRLAALRDRVPEPAGLPHVVIVGGGFGGLAAARGLAGAACRVTLVDQRNYTLFQPLLYQVATGGLSPADIATPIRSLFRGQPNLRVLLGRVTGVSLPTREVVLDRGRLPFDWLILATGSEHSYFGRSDWAPWAPGLKRIEDATEVRRRLLTAFERAENADSPAEQAGWLTFVVVGGGPTGVELAGAIAELARNGLSREFRAIDPGRARVLLVQSAPRLLPTFPESLSREAATELARIGVEVRLGARVEAIDEDGATVSGERIAARTVLWAAGVMASPAGAWLGAAVDRAGRVVVGPDLSVAPHATVFAVGDTAAAAAWAGQVVPGLAPAAKQAGAYVASVIRARLSHRPVPPPFAYRHAGSLATIGRRSAVAELGRLRVRGALAWWLWGAVHIAVLAGGRNRLTVLLDWTWAYATYRSSTRLITGGP